MDHWIKLNSQTAGKDKFARLIQYLSRFIWYQIEKEKNLRDVVLKLKILENSLSSFRKLLRFGKSVEVMLGALKTIHLSNPFLRLTITFSKIYQSLFLFFDHLIWLTRTGILNLDKFKLSSYSNRFWLGSIILNLLRDAYEIYLIMQEFHAKKLNISFSHEIWPQNSLPSCASFTKSAVSSLKFHPDVVWDTIKNICDIWIPLSALDKVKINPGMVGLLGTISSLAGLVTVINPLVKLVPN